MDSDVKESSHQNGITAIGNLVFGTVHCSKEGRVRVSVTRDVRRQKTEKISKMKHFTSSTSKLAINAKALVVGNSQSLRRMSRFGIAMLSVLVIALFAMAFLGYWLINHNKLTVGIVLSTSSVILVILTMVVLGIIISNQQKLKSYGTVKIIHEVGVRHEYP